MRRLGLLLAVMMLALAATAGVAIAQNIIQCTSVPCAGTNQEDRIFERKGDNKDDLINGKGKGDVINAAKFDGDEDVVRGGGGNDRIRVDDGDFDDFVNCGAGNEDLAVIDIVLDTGFDETANCETVRVDVDENGLEAEGVNFSTATVEQIIDNSDPAPVE